MFRMKFMLSERQAGFLMGWMKIKSFLVIFAVACFYAVPVAFCAPPQQSGGTPAAQDANSTPVVVPATPETAETDLAAGLTVDQLDGQKKKISDSKELSDEVKAKINDIYDQAITQLKQALELETKTKDFIQRRTDAPVDLEKAKEDLAKQTAFTAPEVPADITLTQAEQKLTEATLVLDQAKKNSEYWENEPKRRADRRAKIPDESSASTQKLDEIDKKIAAAKIEANSSQLSQANLMLLAVQRRTFKAQVEANTQELLCYDARRDVLSAKRDFASRQLAFAQKSVEFWQQKVNDLRIKEAQAAKKEAEQVQAQTGTSTPEIIKNIVQDNVDLTAEQTKLVDKIEKTSQYLKQIDEQRTSITKDFKDVQDAVDAAGKKISNIMGILLLTKRSEFPNVQQNKQRLKTRLAEISEAQLRFVQYDKEWSELNNIEQYADNLIKTIEPPLSDSERQTLINQLQNRRNTLEALKELYLTYFTDLQKLDSDERVYVDTVHEYANFIDANILWVKTSSTFNLKNVPETAASLTWLASAQNWRQAAKFLWEDFKKNPLHYMGIIAFFLLSVILHRKMHGIIEALSKKVLDVSTDSFIHTIKVLVLTIFLTATWPILILFLQWRLSLDTSGVDFVQALAGGLLYLAAGVFVFELLRHITMPTGLMPDHFRVREDALVSIRMQMRWFFAVIIPLMFIFRIFQVQQSDEVFYNTTGRLVFILVLVLLAVFLLRLLRLTGPVTGPYIKRHPDGWIGRFRYIWYSLCLILPVGFSITAAIGYFYAARYLTEKFMITLVLVLLIVFFKAMLTRWLLVTRRKLALIERQKREAEAAAREEAAEAAEQPKQAESAPPQQSQAKPEKTIFEISQQTNRLINAIVFVLIAIGLWYIWQDALPALSALGDIVIWANQEITLGAFVTALIIIIMTVITARNVPGLLEIVVLRRLPVDAALRFAVTTVCRYIIVIVGVVLAFTNIGIGWSKVQWLVAAITVGLGFGLQEIFANFISGLIILFEQPIRVDDVVTVGDVTGTVTKIKIRATTIRKWDQRELIVPNKEFITGRLINWTLSDKILRRDFIVGIAYGSDIAKAEKTLYEVAQANPFVLENPKPMVLFRSFGDSSLEFELRVYVSGIDNYLPVWHGINCAINDAFRKAGIEIAFPQRDIHIRSNKTNIPVDVNKPPEFS
jgi:potassium efflux system protein